LLAAIVSALSLQACASYPDVPWTITHTNDLAPVSSGARYAWCELTFDAHKGDSLEVGWQADGPVDFYLYAPDGSRLMSLDMCPAHALTWDVGTDGAYRASWCNPTDRGNVHIDYNVTLKHGGEGASSHRTRWSLPAVHIHLDTSRIIGGLPYIATVLISVLIGMVGVAVVSHRARHPRPDALNGTIREGLTAAYCPYLPVDLIDPDGTPGSGAPSDPRGPHG
jgi:hypothetical protein